jgi:cytochrome P450
MSDAAVTVPLPLGPPPLRWYRPDRFAGSGYNLITRPLAFVGERFDAYGDTYRVDEGGGRTLFVTRDAGLFRNVLVENPKDWRKRGGANDRLIPILGDGLLTADGDVWKAARQKLQPGFRSAVIDGFADTILEGAQAVPWQDGETRDVGADMMRLTLSIVCRSLFHHDPSQDMAVIEDTMASLHEAMDDLPLPQWVPTPARRRTARALQRLDEMMYGLIRERRSQPGRTDLLSMLLEAGFDDRQVRDQLVTFFLAGHETTSHTLSWCWWLLSQHPKAALRVQEEADGVIEPMSAATPLPYTQAVIAESMRLFPPAYAIPRVAERDTTLGPWAVKAGTQVVLWVWHLHRHDQNFHDPEQFRPERFLSTSNPAAYHPFGAGTRMCIGASFARLELRLLIAALSKHWHLSATPGHTAIPAPGVTLAPRGGMPMRVTSR